jgi:hypothetical protein
VYDFSLSSFNKDNSADISHSQETAWVPDMFSNIYLLKNHKIANNLTTTEAREKISANSESQEFQKYFNLGLSEFNSNQILLSKICRQFLVTTKLFTW